MATISRAVLPVPTLSTLAGSPAPYLLTHAATSKSVAGILLFRQSQKPAIVGDALAVIGSSETALATIPSFQYIQGSIIFNTKGHWVFSMY